MLFYTSILLLPDVFCASLGDTTKTLPESLKPTPTRLHSHAHPHVPTSTSSRIVMAKQGHPTEGPAYSSWALAAILSASLSTTSQCPPLHSLCGSVGSYDPSTEQCCGKRGVCKITQNCVEVQLHNGTMAAGCCPGGTLACDGVCFDASTSKCCAAPGGTHGLCSANQDCCGNMCCDEGAVCANGFNGPMCWQKHDKGTEEIEGHAFIPPIIPVPSTQKSGSVRIKAPGIFHVLLFLAQFVAGSSEQTFPATRLQSLPIPHGAENTDMGNLTSSLNKRSSCEPLELCGNGCQYKPSKCCFREDSTYGSCNAGDVCCQEYCCPSNTICMVASVPHSSGPWCWPPELPRRTANVPYDPFPWPHDVDGTGFKNTRIKNGSAGTRPSGVLCVIVFLLSVVVASSALESVSMNITIKNVDGLPMTVPVTMPTNPPSEVDIDIDMSQKKGGGGHGGGGGGGGGGHGSGGGGAKPGGGAPGAVGGGHRNTAARPAIPWLFQFLI